MHLNKTEIEQFKDQGFLPVMNLLTPLEVKALKIRLIDIGNKLIEFPKEHIQFEPKVTSGELDKDKFYFNNIRKISYLTKYDTIFAEYARHPKIIEVLTSLIGEDIKIYLDQTLCKPPNIGSANPPHQDSAYWTDIDPPNQVVCWMALDDATEENACMRFIPGSHKKGLIEHKHLEDFRIDNENYDYDLEKAVPLKAGSCTFHHSLVIHRTDPNKSPNRRIGLTIGYMSAKSKFIGKGPKPEYDLVAGSNFPGCV